MELRGEHIVKYYNTGKGFGKNATGKCALNDVSFSVSEGIYGLMGANGAGKSTLMNILVGNLMPTSGKLFLNGVETEQLGEAFRAHIGYMPQQQWVYEDMTCVQFLEYIGALKGMKKEELKESVGKVLDFVNMTEHATKRAGALSGGMRQRLLLAQAILGDPEILILDEPTAGVDPNERIRIRNLISQISFNKIVLIATHVVSDIEFIANRFLLLKEGVLFREGTLPELLKEIEGKVFECLVPEEAVNAMEKKYEVVSLMREEEFVRIRIVADRYTEGYEAVPVKPRLEDLYLYHYGME
ncbi:MAG: ATP-binding cassette domain-containing protein [Lachnospiraceae bacterium]|nr:ATP-binding cassette domain-containing protein [Lachnospiraceae bacterium]